jgi:hypothetical protein
MSDQPRFKHETYFEKVKEFRERFIDESSDVLQKRLADGTLFKEAAVAIREILEERSKEGPNSK